MKQELQGNEIHKATNPVVGCSVDRPLRLRPITDADLTAASNEGYQQVLVHFQC